ncbi:unnamed protein product [Acanthoscelides obtectus]|uniref:Uncharacterized protein n=1 Tax=Acanthoscelides obtectus TaxID=200917 RepID=A0A9P0Q089_ACAOB|nr:unnamed protein product [Acanthoscelides obtectus]CAK1633325.1 hypothetical protein AOBTE_LOCUS8045 [Acanthoscelides obtectus]
MNNFNEVDNENAVETNNADARKYENEENGITQTRDENEMNMFDSNVDNVNKNENQREKEKIGKQNVGVKSLKEIWSKHLHWPDYVPTTSKRRPSIPTPYAITSKQWKEQMEQKEKAKITPKSNELKSNTQIKPKVIFGLKVSIQEDNLLDKVCNELKEYLNVTVERPDIDNVFAIKTDKENVPVKIQFKSYLKKQEIFSNVHKLKGKSISIVNDMCYEDKKNFKVLLKHKREANSKNIPVRIVGNSLEINGLRFTPDQLEVGIAVDDLATGQEAEEDGEVKQNQPDKRLLSPEQIQAEKKQKLDKGEKYLRPRQKSQSKKE